ncbi:MAG: DUF1127 domain-containing protein [Pseudomonadota bacterium]
MFPLLPVAPFDVSEVYRRLRARGDIAHQRRHSRASLREALDLNDSLLRDVGITRDEINHALRSR